MVYETTNYGEGETMRCKIQWISNETGKATPDENEAVGYVYREAYDIQYPTAIGGCIHYEETERFPICRLHAAQLTQEGMEHWHFVPLE